MTQTTPEIETVTVTFEELKDDLDYYPRSGSEPRLPPTEGPRALRSDPEEDPAFDLALGLRQAEIILDLRPIEAFVSMAGASWKRPTKPDCRLSRRA